LEEPSVTCEKKPFNLILLQSRLNHPERIAARGVYDKRETNDHTFFVICRAIAKILPRNAAADY
jgi:hypothetical protein